MGNQFLKHPAIKKNSEKDSLLKEKLSRTRCSEGCGYATSVDILNNVIICQYCETRYMKSQKASIKLSHRSIVDFINETKSIQQHDGEINRIKKSFQALRNQLQKCERRLLQDINNLSDMNREFQEIIRKIQKSTELKDKLIRTDNKAQQTSLLKDIIAINLTLKSIEVDKLFNQKNLRVKNKVSMIQEQIQKAIEKIKLLDYPSHKLVSMKEIKQSSSVQNQTTKRLMTYLPAFVFQDKKKGQSKQKIKVISKQRNVRPTVVSPQKVQQKTSESVTIKIQNFKKPPPQFYKIKRCKKLKIQNPSYLKLTSNNLYDSYQQQSKQQLYRSDHTFLFIQSDFFISYWHSFAQQQIFQLQRLSSLKLQSLKLINNQPLKEQEFGKNMFTSMEYQSWVEVKIKKWIS